MVIFYNDIPAYHSVNLQFNGIAKGVKKSVLEDFKSFYGIPSNQIKKSKRKE